MTPVMDNKNNEPDFVLKGKTLDVYLYLLRHKESAGISEIQKALGLSSPSIASHHLEKLVKLGVASKDELGRFGLEKKVDVGVLQGFANIGTLMVPRFAFYAGFFLVIAIAYVVFDLANLSLLALIGSLGAVTVFCYETLRVWRKRPF